MADKSDPGVIRDARLGPEEIRALAQELVDRYTTREPVAERHGGCGWCGGLPHSTGCLVGRMEAALRAVARVPPPPDGDGSEDELAWIYKICAEVGMRGGTAYDYLRGVFYRLQQQQAARVPPPHAETCGCKDAYHGQTWTATGSYHAPDCPFAVRVLPPSDRLVGLVTDLTAEILNFGGACSHDYLVKASLAIQAELQAAHVPQQEPPA